MIPRMRLVLDTNVALDWLIFRDKGFASILESIEAGDVCLLGSKECLEELRLVLLRPEVCPSPLAALRLLECYKKRVLLLDPSNCNVRLPACSDPDDQKFLLLAAHGQAHGLVTRDKALLRLDRRLKRTGATFTVLKPDSFRNLIDRLRIDDCVHREVSGSD